MMMRWSNVCGGAQIGSAVGAVCVELRGAQLGSAVGAVGAVGAVCIGMGPKLAGHLHPASDGSTATMVRPLQYAPPADRENTALARSAEAALDAPHDVTTMVRPLP